MSAVNSRQPASPLDLSSAESDVTVYERNNNTTCDADRFNLCQCTRSGEQTAFSRAITINDCSVELAEENASLRKCLVLALEKSDLNTANILISVMATCDAKLRRFITGRIINDGHTGEQRATTEKSQHSPQCAMRFSDLARPQRTDDTIRSVSCGCHRNDQMKLQGSGMSPRSLHQHNQSTPAAGVGSPSYGPGCSDIMPDELESSCALSAIPNQSPQKCCNTCIDQIEKIENGSQSLSVKPVQNCSYGKDFSPVLLGDLTGSGGSTQVQHLQMHSPRLINVGISVKGKAGPMSQSCHCQSSPTQQSQNTAKMSSRLPQFQSPAFGHTHDPRAPIAVHSGPPEWILAGSFQDKQEPASKPIACPNHSPSLDDSIENTTFVARDSLDTVSHLDDLQPARPGAHIRTDCTYERAIGHPQAASTPRVSPRAERPTDVTSQRLLDTFDHQSTCSCPRAIYTVAGQSVQDSQHDVGLDLRTGVHSSQFSTPMLHISRKQTVHEQDSTANRTSCQHNGNEPIQELFPPAKKQHQKATNDQHSPRCCKCSPITVQNEVVPLRASSPFEPILGHLAHELPVSQQAPGTCPQCTHIQQDEQVSVRTGFKRRQSPGHPGEQVYDKEILRESTHYNPPAPASCVQCTGTVATVTSPHALQTSQYSHSTQQQCSRCSLPVFGQSPHMSSGGSPTRWTEESTLDNDLSITKRRSAIQLVGSSEDRQVSGNQLAYIIGLTGSEAAETAVQVFYRAVDQVTNYRPQLTVEMAEGLSQARPANRIVGEIAFQLDRRILEHVFACIGIGTPSIRRSRYYGFSVANIQSLILKESKKQGSKQAEIQTLLNQRLNKILQKLGACGYDISTHGEFTQDVVNKYGLLSGIPANGTPEGTYLNDVGALRLLIGRTFQENLDEMARMLVVLDSLHLVTCEEQRPLFIW